MRDDWGERAGQVVFWGFVAAAVAWQIGLIPASPNSYESYLESTDSASNSSAADSGGQLTPDSDFSDPSSGSDGWIGGDAEANDYHPEWEEDYYYEQQQVDDYYYEQQQQYYYDEQQQQQEEDYYYEQQQRQQDEYYYEQQQQENYYYEQQQQDYYYGQ